MALNLIAASTQSVKNTAFPVAAAPMTIGMWVRPLTAGASQSAFSVGDAGATKRLVILRHSDNLWYINDVSVGSISVGSGATVQWYFLLFRYIATDNKRLDVWGQDGSFSQGQQGIGSGTPVFDTFYVGDDYVANFTPWNGHIGEVWYTNTDIQPGGLATTANLVSQLAYRGPFSIPSLKKDIIEYRSFFSAVTNNRPGEVYYSPQYGPQTWTNTNGVLIGDHPQLFYSPEDKVLPVRLATPVAPSTPFPSTASQRKFLSNPGTFMNS